MSTIDIEVEEPSNIVAINPEAAHELEIRHKERQAKFQCPGQHRHIEVDSENRQITCTRCGRIIDPFEYIEQWACEGSRRMEGLRHVEVLRKLAQAEHDDLMRRVKNLRARAKNQGNPQPLEERSAYDLARWNTGREDIVNAAINKANPSHPRSEGI